MKKVVTVHLNGKIFQMDEDAYLHLLQALANQWKKDELETRIAETLEKKIASGQTVVCLADVLEALRQAGITDSGQTHEQPFKRLYRKDSDKMIAGVCTGLGDYLNADTVVIRVLFVVAFFFGSIGLWIYLALWLIVPKAPRTIHS